MKKIWKNYEYIYVTLGFWLFDRHAKVFNTIGG